MVPLERVAVAWPLGTVAYQVTHLMTAHLMRGGTFQVGEAELEPVASFLAPAPIPEPGEGGPGAVRQGLLFPWDLPLLGVWVSIEQGRPCKVAVVGPCKLLGAIIECVGG